jgi:hypothetical protein
MVSRSEGVSSCTLTPALFRFLHRVAVTQNNEQQSSKDGEKCGAAGQPMR